MTQAAQEATEGCYKTLVIYSKALARIALGVSTPEEAQAIAGAALYESAELNKEEQK